MYISSVSLGLVECFNLAVWTAPITGPQIRPPIQIEDTGQRVKGVGPGQDARHRCKTLNPAEEIERERVRVRVLQVFLNQ